MRADIRHRPQPISAAFQWCSVCGLGPRNIIHRLGGRCSVCFRYFKHYELDGSRRCDECRP